MSSLRCDSDGIVSLAPLRSSFLIYLYWGHLVLKCFSSSTIPGQKGQNLKFLSIFRCRPISIINKWFESLSLVRAIRSLTHLIWSKYFSNPGSVLKWLYVRSKLTICLFDVCKSILMENVPQSLIYLLMNIRVNVNKGFPQANLRNKIFNVFWPREIFW